MWVVARLFSRTYLFSRTCQFARACQFAMTCQFARIYRCVCQVEPMGLAWGCA